MQDDAVEEAAQTEARTGIGKPVPPRLFIRSLLGPPLTGSDPVDRLSHLERNGVMDHVACPRDDPQFRVLQLVRQPDRLDFGINDAVGVASYHDGRTAEFAVVAAQRRCRPDHDRALLGHGADLLRPRDEGLRESVAEAIRHAARRKHCAQCARQRHMRERWRDGVVQQVAQHGQGGSGSPVLVKPRARVVVAGGQDETSYLLRGLERPRERD